MYFKAGFILYFLLLSTLSQAQLVNVNNIPNAAANAVVAALHTLSRKDVPVDSISGICSYRHGSCNGATIVLSHHEQTVFQMTLTSIDSFKIPNLKRNENYTLKLTWPKHHLMETKTVTPGEYVTISLTDKK